MFWDSYKGFLHSNLGWHDHDLKIQIVMNSGVFHDHDHKKLHLLAKTSYLLLLMIMIPKLAYFSQS